MTYEEFREAVKELVSSGRYPSKKSCTLPALWIAEKNFPRIDHEIMRIIASELEIPLVEVEEAAEFYAMFHTKPKGKYVIRVCTNLSCMLNGAEEIVEELSRLLGISPGETTPDGLFTLEEYECMGLCDGAPALTVNEERFLNVTKEQLPAILEKFGWKGK
ncbi:NADH-quinone oxidoreductase subunit NuoE family protein [Thermovibrio ammonificans]|jgi:NADH-quinone oxidoreductase E subunit|uniref:NADH dehydrogenase (Ubiquinone) 24 kDa subunit n=1 Tax=Thermovibrio ammonificans (strain DSM 15698 / JCM 12110 / HB-1) TaxID=648996 RepID=E8T6B8_THEA1|nr:NAD(P)H-dependent oxidoreductase subunit E [Thermovibrio ammonificans]ADU96702.1 NADH dehydrogenase (ubiquinone) 24 kDa subunit [Thermovibrio ammonificans HB-1]